jgi:hypothetical protein
MAEIDDIRRLKSLLREAVSDFCSRKLLWKRPVLQTIREIRDEHWNAVLFGGTVRSLLLRRELRERVWPRDIDIVIKDIPIDLLHERFKAYVVRRTRFGGLHLQRSTVPFDIWPLSETWALAERRVPNVDFSQLPETTFFNIEAIAIDLWPKSGRIRRIYSGNDQFFSGIADRTLEINCEKNPFPTLCVVRGLLFASSLNFSLGPRFAQYVADHGPHLSAGELENVQLKHYGARMSPGEQIEKWIRFTIEGNSRNKHGPVTLPRWTQLSLWNEHRGALLRLHAMAPQAGSSDT